MWIEQSWRYVLNLSYEKTLFGEPELFIIESLKFRWDTNIWDFNALQKYDRVNAKVWHSKHAKNHSFLNAKTFIPNHSKCKFRRENVFFNSTSHSPLHDNFYLFPHSQYTLSHLWCVQGGWTDYGIERAPLPAHWQCRKQVSSKSRLVLSIFIMFFRTFLNCFKLFRAQNCSEIIFFVTSFTKKYKKKTVNIDPRNCWLISDQ